MNERKQHEAWYGVYDDIRKSVVLVEIARKEKMVEGDKIIPREAPLGYGSGFILLKPEKFLSIMTANHILSGHQREHKIINGMRRIFVTASNNL